MYLYIMLENQEVIKKLKSCFELHVQNSYDYCFQRFTNEDHLSVHMRKHDLSLALNLSVGGLTPTSIFTGRTLCVQLTTEIVKYCFYWFANSTLFKSFVYCESPNILLDQLNLYKYLHKDCFFHIDCQQLYSLCRTISQSSL